MEIRIPIGYPSGQHINTTPPIHIFDDFLKKTEIHNLIQAAKPLMQRAKVSYENEGKESDGRTGKNCWIQHKHNPIISRLTKRVSKLIGIPLINAEPIQVIHYGPQQKYETHFDAWKHGTAAGERCMQKGGQRLVTCLLYFNTVKEGGGTGFPELDIEVEAKEGRMVVFHNCHLNSNERHPHSLHGGMPVTKGEKWACNLWFREGAFQKNTKIV